MIIKDIKISQCDVPNANGVIYPKEEWEKALKAWEGKQIPVTFSDSTASRSGAVNLEKVIGFANEVKIQEDGKVTADIKITMTESGKLYSLLELDKLHHFSCGSGKIKKDNSVEDFSFSSIGVEYIGLPDYLN